MANQALEDLDINPDAIVEVAEVAEDAVQQVAAAIHDQPEEVAAPVEPPQEPKLQRIRIGGVSVKLPAGLSQDKRKTVISNFIQSEEFAPFIDKDTGAPARVRVLVGSAPEKDRLANIQRVFPDAIPFDEDNFVYTSPETGKITLYNPTGLDIGDVAAVAKEGAIAAFGGLGAAVGAVGGPPGAAIGAGTGGAVGAELFDASADFLMGRIDTRGPLESMISAGTEFLSSASGQRAGDILGTAIKKGLGGSAAVKGMVSKFRSLQIDPPAAAVTNSRTVATMEKTLEGSPFASDVMQKQAETVLGQVKSAAQRTVSSFGPAKTPQGVGETIKKAATKAAERFGLRQAKIYDDAFDLIGKETPVTTDAISTLRDAMETELSRAPLSLKNSLGRSIDMLKMLEKDALDSEFGGIPFEALRAVRTAIGKDIDQPLLSGSTGAQNAALKRIYGALTEDMTNAARASGGRAEKMLRTADRYTRRFVNTTADTLNKIGKFDTDEQAFRYAMNSANDGGTILARLRGNFEVEEWDIVAASVLNKLGKATPGAQDVTGEAFSVNTFMTNWSKLAPEAKKALFGGSRYSDLAPELDTLVTVMSSLKGVEKVANTSNTGRVMITWMTVQALGGALAGAAVGGDAEGGLAGAGAAVFAPRMAAKLITSPKFVRWLGTAVKDANGIGGHIGRLTSIAKDDPELRDEIGAYLEVLTGKERAVQ